LTEKKSHDRQHHISVYMGYGAKGERRKQIIIDEAKKHGFKSPSRFIWYCIGKVTKTDFLTPVDDIAIREYKKD